MRARRLPVVDEYAHGLQVAVFAGGQVLVLSEVATAALLGVGEDWTPLDEVAAHVGARVGPPPDGDLAQATRALLTDLADAGLVELA